MACVSVKRIHTVRRVHLYNIKKKRRSKEDYVAEELKYEESQLDGEYRQGERSVGICVAKFFFFELA